jgi:hypothetical protein
VRNSHFKKSSAPFLPFLGKSAENSAADFLGIFLRFAAEILAGWQHCANNFLLAQNFRFL